jgi:hypothetical protein
MSDSTTSSVLRARKQELQYLLAGAISLAFVGMTILHPEFAGIEGITGYFFVVVLVGYVFVLASDRLRQSQYYPFFQAIYLPRMGWLQRLAGSIRTVDDDSHDRWNCCTPMGRISAFTGGRFGGIEYWSAPSKYGNIDEYFALNLEDVCSNFTSYLFGPPNESSVGMNSLQER